MVDIDLKEFDVIYQHSDELKGAGSKMYKDGLDHLVNYFKGFQEGELSSMKGKLLEREKSRINGRILFLRRDLSKPVKFYSLELPHGTFDLLELCRENGYQIINGDGGPYDSD